MKIFIHTFLYHIAKILNLFNTIIPICIDFEVTILEYIYKNGPRGFDDEVIEIYSNGGETYKKIFLKQLKTSKKDSIEETDAKNRLLLFFSESEIKKLLLNKV